MNMNTLWTITMVVVVLFIIAQVLVDFVWIFPLVSKLSKQLADQEDSESTTESSDNPDVMVSTSNSSTSDIISRFTSERYKCIQVDTGFKITDNLDISHSIILTINQAIDVLERCGDITVEMILRHIFRQKYCSPGSQSLPKRNNPAEYLISDSEYMRIMHNGYVDEVIDMSLRKRHNDGNLNTTKTMNFLKPSFVIGNPKDSRSNAESSDDQNIVIDHNGLVEDIRCKVQNQFNKFMSAFMSMKDIEKTVPISSQYPNKMIGCAFDTSITISEKTLQELSKDANRFIAMEVAMNMHKKTAAYYAFLCSQCSWNTEQRSKLLAHAEYMFTKYILFTGEEILLDMVENQDAFTNTPQYKVYASSLYKAFIPEMASIQQIVEAVDLKECVKNFADLLLEGILHHDHVSYEVFMEKLNESGCIYKHIK